MSSGNKVLQRSIRASTSVYSSHLTLPTRSSSSSIPRLHRVRARRFATLRDPNTSISAYGPAPPPPPTPIPDAEEPSKRAGRKSRSATSSDPESPTHPANSVLDGILIDAVRRLPIRINWRDWRDSTSNFAVLDGGEVVGEGRRGKGEEVVIPTLRELLNGFREVAGRQLECELEYQATPSASRRVEIDPSGLGPKSAWLDHSILLQRRYGGLRADRADVQGGEGQIVRDDGIVLVAHVYAGDPPSTTICTGFAIKSQTKDGEGDDGEVMILTCAHTLLEIGSASALSSTTLASQPSSSVSSGPQQSQSHTHSHSQAQQTPSSQPQPTNTPPSASLIMTRSGHLLPVTKVHSSLPESDLLLLGFSDRPISPPFPLASPPSRTGNGKTGEEARSGKSPISRGPRVILDHLPVNPYPVPAGTEIWAHVFGKTADGEGVVEAGKGKEKRWEKRTVVGYKDVIGRDAEMFQLPGFSPASKKYSEVKSPD